MLEKFYKYIFLFFEYFIFPIALFLACILSWIVHSIFTYFI